MKSLKGQHRAQQSNAVPSVRRRRLLAALGVVALTSTTWAGAAQAQFQAFDEGSVAPDTAVSYVNDAPTPNLAPPSDEEEPVAEEPTTPEPTPVEESPVAAEPTEPAPSPTESEESQSGSDSEAPALPIVGPEESPAPAPEEPEATELLPGGPVNSSEGAAVGRSRAVRAAIPTGGIQAQMALHSGWTSANGNPSPQGGDYIRYGILSNSSSSTWAPNTGGDNGSWPRRYTDGYTAWVGYGTTAYSAHGSNGGQSEASGGVDLARKSALGFSPSAVTTVEPGTYFNLGRMVHRNNPISTESTWYRGNMNIRFAGMDLAYRWRLNETPNNSWPVSNPANNDILDFLNQISDQTFVQDGIEYTLVVHGFTAPSGNGTCPLTVANLGTVINRFSTVESAITYGCLYASVQQVRSLTVQKIAEAPAGVTPGTFGFTGTSTLAGSPWIGDFSLTPTALGPAGVASYTQRFVTGQEVTITEAQPTGAWQFSSLACVDGVGNPIGTVSGRTATLSGQLTAASAAAAPITCTYTNSYRNGSLSWQKVSDDVLPVSLGGSEWLLTPINPAGAAISVVDNVGQSGYVGADTDARPGYFTVPALFYGEYTLVETVAPQGFVADSTTRTVTISSPTQSVQGSPIANTRIRGSLEWEKHDDSTPGVRLAGSTWTLTPVAPTPGSAVTIVDNGANDANSIAGVIRVDNVAYGDYTLVETQAPEGYVLDPTVHTVQIRNHGTVVTLNPVVNVTIKGSVTWEKVDDSTPGQRLAGSTWTLTPVAPTTGAVITVVDNGANDANPAEGVLEVVGVAFGTYTLVETQAPAGYVADPTPRTVTIMTQGQVVTLDAVVNTLIRGSVTWSKTTEGTPPVPLSGSEWEITPVDPAGTPFTVIDWTGEAGYVGVDTNPAPGEFSVEALPYGSYTLVETKAPAGFVRDSTPHPFTIETQGQTIALGAYTNRQAPPVMLPLTGGLGSDAFLIGGSFFLVAAGVGGWIHRRRRA